MEQGGARVELLRHAGYLKTWLPEEETWSPKEETCLPEEEMWLPEEVTWIPEKWREEMPEDVVL